MFRYIYIYSFSTARYTLIAHITIVPFDQIDSSLAEHDDGTMPGVMSQ